MIRNVGQKKMENREAHEPIIDKETFVKVQEM